MKKLLLLLISVSLSGFASQPITNTQDRKKLSNEMCEGLAGLTGLKAANFQQFNGLPKELLPLINQAILSEVLLFIKLRLSVPSKALVGHAHYVNSAEFNSTRDKIVTASDDETARIWDVATGECLQILKDHTDCVNSAKFNRAGGKIVTASDDHTARIWDVATGICEKVLKGDTYLACSAEFNSTRDKIVTASDDHTARVRDVVTRECLQVLKGHTRGVRSAEFNSTRDKAVTGSDDNTARIWDVATGNCEQVLKGHEDDVYTAKFNHGGNLVVTASVDTTARVWRVATGVCLQELEGLHKTLTSAEFNTTDDKIITFWFDSSILGIWDRALNEYTMMPFCSDKNPGSHSSINTAGNKTVTISDTVGRIWDSFFLQRFIRGITLDKACLLKALYDIAILEKLNKKFPKKG